jgi:hypothetical protein
MGWWWVIGPAWYLYPAPIYPYPDPDTQILVIESRDTVLPATDICREFHGDAMVNDTGQPFYGTACLQDDGLWHIVTG